MNVLNQLTILAAGAENGADAAEASGLASLGINPLAILFQAGTFVVLFVLIRKFALNKIVSILDERHDTIEEGLQNAELIQKQLAESTQAQQAALKEARVDADAIIAKAHEESGAMLKASEDAAAAKAEKIAADAQSKIAADVAKAKKDLKAEMMALVATATETVIGEKLDEKKDAKLLEKALAGDK